MQNKLYGNHYIQDRVGHKNAWANACLYKINK